MGLDPVPVNLSAIESRAARTAAKGRFASQVTSEENLEEGLALAFNPRATMRRLEQSNRFRSLSARTRSEESKERKIKEVAKKAEEELANRYQQRNSELKRDQLIDLKRSLYEGMTPDEILDQVHARFKDAYLADQALEYLEQTTEGLLKQAVIEARAILNERSSRQILLGRNISPAVAAFYEKEIGSPIDLRKLYSDITGNPRDHNTLFQEFSQEYSFDQIKNLSRFLLKALGYDLKSKGPSIQQAELLRCMTDVRNLQSILWVYNFFKGRMRLVKSLHKKKKLSLLESLGFETLAKEFIKLVEERYPSVMKLLKHAENMGIMMDESKIIILTQYRDAIRNLAPRLYRSMKHRQDLLYVILETLEELEEDEDEE